MKTIYKITLDEEIPLSDKVKDDIKLIAYLTYSFIRDLSEDEMLYTKNINFNELLETKHNADWYTHRFESDKIDGTVEPFMVSDRAFCFTAYEGTLNDNIIQEAIRTARSYVSHAPYGYGFSISSETYLEDDKQKNRLLAIKKLITSEEKKENHGKVRTRGSLPSGVLRFFRG